VINNFCYIHIPFCTSKCKYCRFASVWNLDNIKVNLYVEKLLEEIKTSPLTPLLKGEGNFLKSIYFGWWTPGVLLPVQLEKIINSLKEKIDFDKNIEINIETIPITVTKENIIAWKNMWVNRLSIWVQTLNNDSLIEIWRGEKGNIIKSLDYISEVWFNNVSVDFIIWLPYVKKREIKKDIEYILDRYNFIKHISVYMLEEYYYPWNWNNISITEKEYLWEYIEINNFLKSKGFKRYEISNYALDWYECNHNKAYWNHSNMLAFWLWAHWYINWERFSNSNKFIEYYSWIKVIEEKLSTNDFFLEKVMFGLRTNWLENSLVEKLDNKKIYQFIEDWYMYYKKWILKISDKWILVLDYILKEII
jgi:oxygen-independent coproporphyrinogen-3 oxidase